MLQEANIRRNTGAGANHDQWRVKAFRQMEGGVGFDEYGDFLSHLRASACHIAINRAGDFSAL